MKNKSNLLDRNDISIVLAGGAGQGIKTVETILLRIFKDYGLNIFSCKEYMSRVRGGLNSIQIRIGPERVDAWIDRIDLLLPLSSDISRLTHRIDENTLIIGDCKRLNYSNIFNFSFEEVARDAGDRRASNIVAVGLILALFGVALEMLLNYISDKFAGKPQKTVNANHIAAREGYKKGLSLINDKVMKIKFEPIKGINNDILINGAQAVGLGAIAGGCNFIGSYPMSPATGVLEFLAQQSNDFDIAVEQAEDEIAALNMVLGSWYAGARGLATTSGGGFALMGEAMSLSGITEVPAVVHIAQRPGPGTGLPTRTEQGDLNLALYSGHGDFSRAIYAPGSLSEAYFVTAHSFNVADEFQIPVVILTDQYLMDSMYNTETLNSNIVDIKKHIVKTEPKYQRYKYTENGISPRGVPGFGEGMVTVDSDEHTENGRITEDWNVRNKMMEKRLKRLDQLKENALMPEIIGNASGDIVVIGWGSSRNMIKESVEKLGHNKILYLHFSQVYPINPKVQDFLENAKKIVVIENNFTGQFAELLFTTFRIEIDKKVLQTDGFPFSVEYITDQLDNLEVK